MSEIESLRKRVQDLEDIKLPMNGMLSQDQQARAWVEVWEALKDAGVLSFGAENMFDREKSTGVYRAIAFIKHLAANQKPKEKS